MSIKLMSAVWETKLGDSEKLVLLALADCANDEGSCWPSMKTLAEKCSKSDRTVQAAIKVLVAKGHLSRIEKPGKGCFYHVHPVRPVKKEARTTPEAASPRKDFAPKRLPVTPEAASGHPRSGFGQTVKKHQEPPKIEPNGSCASADAPALKPEHFVEKWNDLAKRLGKPCVRDLTPERRVKLKARIAGYSVDDFRAVLAGIERSAFLRGDKGWSGCTFDWVTKKGNFQKVLEGNYDD